MSTRMCQQPTSKNKPKQQTKLLSTPHTLRDVIRDPSLSRKSTENELSQKKNTRFGRCRTSKKVQNTKNPSTFEISRTTNHQNDSRRRDQERNNHACPPRYRMHDSVNRQQVCQTNRHPLLYPPRKSRLQGIQRPNGRRSRKRIHGSPHILTPLPLLQIGIRSGPIRTQRRPISPLLVAGRSRETRKIALAQPPI